jgi:hypothetical protein
LAALAVVAPFLLFRQPARFGEKQFDELRLGMREAEVVVILGCPPGDYRPAIWSHPDWLVYPSDPIGVYRKERGRSLRELQELELQDAKEWIQAGQPIPPPPGRVQRKRWWARGYGIDVAFDEQGRLIHASLLELSPPRPPHDVLRWVRWRLGW